MSPRRHIRVDPPGVCADQELAQLRRRLHRISGQVLGVERMLTEQRPCQEVLLQLTAVQGALRAMGLKLFTEYVKSTMDDTTCNADTPADDTAAEITTLARLLIGG